MKASLRRLGVLLRVGYRAAPRMAVLAFLLTVVGSAAGPLVGLWLKSMVDAAEAGNESTAITAAAGLSLFWVASIVASQYSEHVQWGLHVHIIRLIMLDLIEMGGRVPTIEMHERPDVADRVELLRQGALSFAFAMTSVVWAVGIVIQLTTTILVLVSVSPALVLLPLLGVPSLIAGGWAQRARQRAWEDTIEDHRLSEHLFGLGTTPGPGKEVRIFGLAGEIGRRHGVLRRGKLARERRAEFRGAVTTTIGWLVYAVGYAAAIVFVTRQAIDGTATVGDVLLVIALAGQIQSALNGAFWLIGDFVGTLRAADHYLWVSDFADQAMAQRRPAEISAPERLADGIRIEGVSFRYPGTEVDVLTDVDLTIPAGAAIAIVGVNGRARRRSRSSWLVSTNLRRGGSPSTGSISVTWTWTHGEGGCPHASRISCISSMSPKSPWGLVTYPGSRMNLGSLGRWSAQAQPMSSSTCPTDCGRYSGVSTETASTSRPANGRRWR